MDKTKSKALAENYNGILILLSFISFTLAAIHRSKSS